MSNHHILLIGAGETGKTLIDLIIEQPDFKLTVMTRQKELRLPEVQTIYYDHSEDFSTLFRNVDYIIYTAEPEYKEENQEFIIRDAVIKIVDYAAQHNIQKIIFISSLFAFDPKQAPEDDQAFIQMKKDADDYIINSGLQYIILRPGYLNDSPGTGRIDVTDQFFNGPTVSRQDLAWAALESIKKHISNKTIGIIGGNTAIEQALRS